MPMKFTRREVLRYAAGGAALAALAPGAGSLPAAPAEEPWIWDAHGHLGGVQGTVRERVDRILHFADRMLIRRLVVSMGTTWAHDPSVEEVRRENDDVLRAVEYAPDRLLGFVYLNPKHEQESQQEIERCVHNGPMVGVKLWVAVHCNQPCVDPIAARAGELRAPILQHTFLRPGPNLPGESTPADMAELAARHPKTTFLCGHLGLDWERGIRTIRTLKNVYGDPCGGDPVAGEVDMAVRELGPERVVYGSDFAGRSFASQLAKVYGANLPEAVQRQVLCENMKRIMTPILKAKGMKL
jgi:predicted TIM-barrel fold metal-dependent hydrolase